MNIRAATLDDAEAIAQVHLASWKTTYPGIIAQEYIDSLRVENGTAMWRTRLTEHGTITFIAEDESGLFGFAAGGAMVHPVDGYDGELGAIYLLASHHKQGTGRRLVHRIAAVLHEQGFRSMVVWVLEANPARHFYERLGGVYAGAQFIQIGGQSLPEIAYGWPDICTLIAKPEAR